MVSAIQFAVRDSAGGRQLGSIAGDEQGNFIQVGAGDSISLNISPASVVAYEHQGRDLVIKLADGRVIVLANYFDDAGGTHHLYLSADGQISEVMLTDDGSGVMMASYGPAQGWDKWSPLDDLRFAEGDPVVDSVGVSDEPAGMGIFAPALLAGTGGLGAGALGLAGLGLLTGGGGGGGGTDTTPGDTTPGGGDTTPGGGDTTPGGGDTTPGGGDTTPGGGDTTPGGGDTTPGGGDTTPGGGDTTPGGGDTTPGGGDTRVDPTVDNPDSQSTLTTNTPNPVIVITGTGEPGDAVAVTIGGETQNTTITPGGTWGVEFSGDNLPPDGTYSSTVVVTPPVGDPITLDGPDYIIDMTPPAVEVTEGTQSVGDIENLVDYQDGVTIAGQGEAGASIVVQVEGTSHSTTVAADGTWSVTFSQTEVAGGERSVPVTVTATDPLGNVTTVTDTLVIDTVPHPVNINPVTADNTVSQSEFDAGFSIAGSTTAGAVITLSVEGVTRTATAGADGSWSVSFPSGTLPGGTYQAQVTASTVDAAGNTSSTTRSFNIDTEVTVSFAPDPIAGDNIVNMTEASTGVTMTGSSQAGSSVSVEWGGTTRPATVSADGSWTVTFPGAQVPTDGTTTATVTATDSVGNSSSATRTIVVDTATSVSVNANQTGDDVISGTERGAGFSLTGQAEPGATVVVQFEGISRTVTADASGTWTSTYASNEIRSGFYEAGVTVTATDLAGNTASSGRMIFVDTETNVSVNTGQVGGDDVISGAERSGGITLTGMAEPGATVEVTFEGTTRTVTANSSGQWSAPYSAAEIPAGTSSSTVSVRATDVLGNTATATHDLRIDTEVVPLTRETLSAGSDNVVNQAESARGLTITGTVEAGSTVMVQFGTGAPHAATVAGNGTWSVAIPTGDIPAGEASATMTVTATDAYGNTAVHTEAVAIDRVVRNFQPSPGQLSGDGYLNAEEAAQGLVISGTAEPGASVQVQIAGGGQMTVTASPTGAWSTTFTGANLPRGEVDTTVTVTATDRAGNVASYTQDVMIDTIAPGAPDVEAFTRNALGLTRIETDDAEESYDFTRIDTNGNVSNIDAVHSVDEVFGTQNVTFGSFGSGGFTSTPVPDGSYLVVNTTDLAGNESSTLLVVNNTNAPDIDLSRPGLSGFDFSAIDLTFAPDADLTITEAQILNITGADKTLVIKGDIDDNVSIVGGVNTNQTQEIDGEMYNIYTVGTSGATVLLDDDITVI